MLVNFKRDFFGPGGVLYRKGTREFNGEAELLPRDALVTSKEGHLPVQSNSPKAGHGAKPLEEQVLDLIPGASPTHQIDVSATSRAPALTEDERKQREADADKAREESRKKLDTENKDLVAETEAGVKNAEKAAELVEEATDPLAAIMSGDKGKAPAKK